MNSAVAGPATSAVCHTPAELTTPSPFSMATLRTRPIHLLKERYGPLEAPDKLLAAGVHHLGVPRVGEGMQYHQAFARDAPA